MMSDISCALPLDTESPPVKKLKRGDVREDGMVFWNYERGYIGGMRWVTTEKYSDLKRRSRERYASNRLIRERHSAYQKERYANDPTFAERKKAANAKRRADPLARERDRAKEKEHYANDPLIKARQRARHRQRYANDTVYAFAHRTRTLIRRAIRRGGYEKSSRTADILGCSFEELRAHIESQFSDGMSWDTFAGIHIDHIVPISSALNEADIIRLNHYTNLQPLWAFDNLSKGAKIL